MMSKLSLYFFTLLLVSSLILVSIVFFPYLGSLIFSIVIGVMFLPLHKRIHAVFKNSGLSAFISTLIVILIILGPVALIASQLLREAGGLYTKVQNNNLGYFADLMEQKLQAYFPNLTIDLEQYTREGLSWLISQLGGVFSGATSAILSFSISAIALYYWFKSTKDLKTKILQLSPMPNVYDEQIIQKLSITIHSLIRGTMLIAIIQATLVGIGFYIFGVPNPVLWATLALISALIPGIGTALVVTPGVIYLFLTGDTPVAALGLLAWGITIVGLIDNLLGPKLMSRGSEIHPLFLLVSVLGGIELLGPIGFLAGPMIVSLFFSLLDIYLVLAEDHKKFLPQ